MNVMFMEFFDNMNDKISVAAGFGCWQNKYPKTYTVARCQHEGVVYLP